MSSRRGRGECVFCAGRSRSPEESLVLFNGAVSTVMLNKFPYNSAHLLISPARHVANVEELTPEEALDSFRLLRHSITVLKKVYNPAGFNVGMNLGGAAGAGIEAHLHTHVVPRWNGDMNFMPILVRHQGDLGAHPGHPQKTPSILPEHRHKRLPVTAKMGLTNRQFYILFRR